MTTKKKVLTILLSAAGVCMVGAGVVYGVKSAQSSEVMVVPVSDINNGGYWGDNATMQGMVTSDVSQDVYLTDAQTVDQVKVKEGDMVKEGDVLLTYDMTLTNLNLEMQRLGREQADLRVQVAKNNLKKLKNTKPVSESSGGGMGSGDDGFVDMGGDDQEDSTPDEVVVFDSKERPLTYEALTKEEYYAGSGSKEDPFRFLCKDKTVIEASFINAMMGYEYDEKGEIGNRVELGFYFRLEIRKGDTVEGALLKSWQYDNFHMESPYTEEWKAAIDLDKNIVTPTPSPKPSTTPSPTPSSTPFPTPSSTPGPSTSPTPSPEPTPTAPVTETPTPSPTEIPVTGTHSSARAGSSVNTAMNLTMKGTGKFIFTATTPNKDSKPGGISSGITSDMTYTKEELAKAIKEKEAEIKTLELDLKEQDIKLRATEKAVSEGQVVARINGVVKKVGDPKNPPKDGSPFLVVSSTEGLYVKGAISELKLNDIKEGTVVSIISYQSGATCEATIKDISPFPVDNYQDYNSGGNASGYPFTAYIASGGDQLQNNEYVDVSLSQQPTDEEMMGGDTISLSKAFIREEDGVKFVYLRGEDGRLKRQEVTTGRLFWGDTYEVKSGISVDDWIAFPYGKNVKEEAKTKEGTMNQLYGY